MRRTIRWARRLARLVFLLLLFGAGMAAIVGRLSLPREEGVAALKRDGDAPSLSAGVSIRRDRNGAPHIKAKSREDAAFALGFAQAQDRLWQLEMNRRIASGTLAEILGEPGLSTDRFIRTLGLRRAAEAHYARLPADARAELRAFAAGINAFIEQEMQAPPVEFWLTRTPPGRWSPVDSIAWLVVMALDLGGNFNQELYRIALARTMSVEEIWRVFPPYADEAPPATLDFAALYRSLGVYRRDAKNAALPGRISPFLDAGTDGLGSNNWVVSGARTVSGKPLLANDPHLGLTTPAIWYFAHIETPEMNVIGATLPGVPGIVLGRNRRIAWGFTNTNPDVQDLYLEQIDPADPKRYRTPDGFAAFEERREIIKVRGGEDVVLTVRSTRHGPVVTDVMPGLSDYLDATKFEMALRWTALDADNPGFLALGGLARAKNVAEAREALRSYVAPMQNVVLADVDGAIGFIAAGRAPKRKPENDLKGIAPAPGWEARYDWDGFLPFEALPQSDNPAPGVIVTANQRVQAKDDPDPLTFDWTPPDRYDRIVALLGQREKHSIESFRAIQADVKSPAAGRLLPFFRAAETASQHRLAAQAREAARNFDGTMRAESAAPLIFSSFADQLARGVFFDELPPAVRNVYAASNRDLRQGLDGVLARNDARWCDDSKTPAAESCEEMARAAYDRGLDEIARLYGEDVGGWKWGAAHAARSEHRPLGRVSWLARLFDVVAPAGGDTYTINVGRMNLNDRARPFMTTHAASLRAIYDLSDLEKSRFIYQTGQSGNIFSRHYRDMAGLWAQAQTLPLTLDPEPPIRELVLTAEGR